MKFLRLGVCALVVFGVLAHGGVEPWARAFLESGAGLLFLVWAVRAFFQKEEITIISPLLLPLLAFAILVFGQWSFRATASAYTTRTE